MSDVKLSELQSLFYTLGFHYIYVAFLKGSFLMNVI